jgi:hypothetical protein
MDDTAQTEERAVRTRGERLAGLTLVAVFLFNVYRFLNV